MPQAKKTSLDSVPLGELPEGGIVTHKGDVVDVKDGVIIHETTENGMVQYALTCLSSHADGLVCRKLSSCTDPGLETTVHSKDKITNGMPRKARSDLLPLHHPCRRRQRRRLKTRR